MAFVFVLFAKLLSDINNPSPTLGSSLGLGTSSFHNINTHTHTHTHTNKVQGLSTEDLGLRNYLK